MATISRSELQALLAQGNVVLLEALPSSYFEAGHLPTARNLPIDKIDELAPLLIPDTRSHVVTYCAGPTCANSVTAAKRLEALGYRNVSAYEGGKEDWVDAGLELETGVEATP